MTCLRNTIAFIPFTYASNIAPSELYSLLSNSLSPSTHYLSTNYSQGHYCCAIDTILRWKIIANNLNFNVPLPSALSCFRNGLGQATGSVASLRECTHEMSARDLTANCTFEDTVSYSKFVSKTQQFRGRGRPLLRINAKNKCLRMFSHLSTGPEIVSMYLQ